MVLQGSPHYYGPHRFKFAPEHPISIDLPDWVREGAQVYLPSSYHPGIRGRVEYPPEIEALTR